MNNSLKTTREMGRGAGAQKTFSSFCPEFWSQGDIRHKTKAQSHHTSRNRGGKGHTALGGRWGSQRHGFGSGGQEGGGPGRAA